MSLPIAPISSIPAILPDIPAGSLAGPSSAGFGAVLQNAISTVVQIQNQSDQTVEKFLSGEGGDLHTTILATQRAEMTFQLFMQVRNKVVAAYQAIMQMQD